MDKFDLILDKLTSMEKSFRTENKILSDKVNTINKKVEMSWQAIQKVRDELTENSVKIKIIDNKVKAL